MSRKRELIVQGQISWNLSSGETRIIDNLAELPKVRQRRPNLETKDGDINKRPAYLKEDTVKMLMDRTRFLGDKVDFLKTLVIFPQGARILFDKKDNNTNRLISPTIAHEVQPIDDWDVPVGCKWYQVISSFINDDKKMKRNCVHYQNDRVDHPSSLGVKEYFFANPNAIASSGVYLSKFSKNSWGKMVSSPK